MKRLTVVLFSFGLLIAAAVPGGSQEGGIRAPQPTDRRVVDPSAKPAPALDESMDVFIRLDEPSVAEFVAGSPTEPGRAAQQAQTARVQRQQDQARRQLARFEIEEHFRLQVGVNGIRADVKVRDLPQLAQLPGVLSVAPVTLHHPSSATSVPWIGGSEFWQAHGLAGESIDVAIIDTGIDYLHADFGGSGDPEDYAANDPTVVEPGSFPTAKVVGGTDFAGVDYDAGDPDKDVPQPDDDPLDVNGHGSHVAAIAAGLGVLDDGSSYAGPYDGTTYDNDFAVGPGVAPRASLYAFKVFGDITGSTALTSVAIERALDPNQDGSIDDRVDVINMSLGSDFGSPNDPSALASQHAAENGVIVVASAGNDGDIPYVTGSPAIAPAAISVAASVDGGHTVGAIQVHSPPHVAGLYEAEEGGFTRPLSETGPVTGDLVLAEPLEACQELTNAAAVSGNIAFLQRGTCRFDLKIANAQEAGAIAAVVFNNVAGSPFTMGGDPTGIEIPAVMISLEDGDELKSTIEEGDTVNATLSDQFELAKPELADTLASFTSRGPGAFTSFKPDLGAPGFGIESAAVGRGTQSSRLSGTSMAAPHVAGAAALLRQQHPGLPVDAIKSLLANSTVPAQGDPAPPLARQGVGIVRAEQAGSLSTYTSPAGQSFGRLNPVDDHTETRTIAVTNLSGDAKTFDITPSTIQSVSGVSLETPDSVTVPANGTARFEARLHLEPAAMPSDDGFRSQTEVDGHIVLAGDTEQLSIGFLSAVDPASAVVTQAIPRREGRPTELFVSNPSETLGWAEGYTLAREGDDIGGTFGAIGFRTGEISGTPVVRFGVAQTEPWDSLSIRETDIFLDTDQDGDFDFVLVAADLGYLLGGGADGRVVTALFDLDTGSGFLEWFVRSDFNDQVQELIVDRHGGFGFLEEGDAEFDYLAVGFDLRFGLDSWQQGSVDLDQADGRDNPSFGLQGGDSTTIEVRPSDRDAMLWFYQNNVVGEQFQVLNLASSGRR